MAKEFKDWEKKFTRDQLNKLHELWIAAIKRRQQKVADILERDVREWLTSWFWVYHEQYEVASRDWVHDAVYCQHDAAGWQMFRCMLKGLSTPEKLAILAERWDMYVKESIMGNSAVERIRINNYIGALRRGGFLDANFNVVK